MIKLMVFENCANLVVGKVFISWREGGQRGRGERTNQLGIKIFD